MKRILSIIALCLVGLPFASGQGVGGKGGVGGKAGFGGGVGAPSITLDGSNHCVAGSASASSLGCSLPSVTAGDMITVPFTERNGYLVNVSDATNGNYNIIFYNPESGNPSWGGLAYFCNAASGTYSPTVNFSTSDSQLSVAAEAWKNTRSSLCLDSAAVTQFHADTSGSANAVCGTSTHSPTGNGELIFVAVVFDGATTTTAGANYALIDQETSFGFQYPEYWIQPTGTATNGPYTSASNDYIDSCGAFLPSTASAGVTPFPGTSMNGSGGTNSSVVTNAALVSSTHGPASNTGSFTYQPSTISSQWTWTNSITTPLLGTKWANGSSYSGAPSLSLEYTTITTPTSVTYSHWYDGTNQASSWNTSTLAAWVQWDVLNADTNAYDFMTIYNGAGGEFTVVKITNGTLFQEVKSGDTCTVGCSGLAINPNTWYGVILQYNNATASGTHIAEVCNTSGTLLFTGNVTTASTNKAGNSEIGPSGAEPETAGKHFYFDWIMDNWLNPPVLTGTNADCTALL